MKKSSHIAVAVLCAFCLAASCCFIDALRAWAAPGDTKWSYQLGGNSTASPAIGDDGTVYVGSDDGHVYAFDGTNGTVLWNVDPAHGTPSSPAIGEDGVVFVGTSGQYLVALNGTTGQTLWEYDLGNQCQSDPAIGGDGTVYVAAYLGNLFAMYPNGTLRWHGKIGSHSVHSSPSIGENGMLYVGAYDHHFYAVNATTGAHIWIFTAGSDIASSPAIGADGTLYFGSSDGRVHAVNGTTGVEKWCSVTWEGAQMISSPAIGSDGTVYIGSGDGCVYALKKEDGDNKWTYYGKNPFTSSPTIGSDGIVYIGGENGEGFFAFKEDYDYGPPVWHLDLDTEKSSAALANDGTLYVCSNNTLYALETSSRGLARSAWPKYRLNNWNRAYNFPPTADAGAPGSVARGGTANLNGLNSHDPDGTIAAYLWTQTSGTSVALSDASSPQPSFTAPDAGSGGETLEFRLTVSDNNQAQASDSVYVNVGGTGPKADAGPDQTVSAGRTVTLNGSNSTAPGTSMASYAWSQIAGPIAVLADPSAPATTFTTLMPSGVGEALAFKLTVVDLGGLTGTDTAIVNVTNFATPPTADAGGDQSVAEGDTVLLSASGSTPPEGGAITAYSWTQTSGETMVLSATNRVNATFVAPSVSEESVFAFRLAVTDSNGLQASDKASITVRAGGGNDKPPVGFTPVATKGGSAGNKTLGLNCSAGASMTALEAVDPDTVPNGTGKPADLPYGLLNFTLKVPTAGDSANVTVALPDPASAGAMWYKYDSASGWHDYTENATFDANRTRVVIQLTDGGAGDSDGTANGFITDPSGLASGTSSGSSSGCLMNPATGPGLEWLALLAAPAAILAARRNRR